MSGLTPLPPMGVSGGPLPPVHGGGASSVALVPAGIPPMPPQHPPAAAAPPAPAAPGSIPWPSMPMLNPYEMASFDVGPVPAPRARGRGVPSSSGGGRRREAQQIYAVYWGQMKDRDMMFVHPVDRWNVIQG